MKILLLTLALLFSRTVWTQVLVSEKSYGYPQIDSLDATLGVASIGIPYGARWTNIKLYPLKRTINGNKHSIEVRYYDPAKHCELTDPKKIIYLLAGLGGTVDGGHLNYYAYKFSQKCFYVLIFPSVFTQDFVKAASTSGIIGNPENDMKDFYHLITHAKDYIKRTRNIEFIQSSLMGFSLGGFSAAYMGKIDQEENELNLKSVLIVNTPVDLFSGMKIIDGYQHALDDLRFFRKLKIYLKFSRKARHYRRVHLDSGSYYRFTEKLSFLNHREKRALISKALSSNLASMILSCQETYLSLKGNNFNIFPIKGSKRKWAKSFNFIEYFKEIVLGYNQEIGSVDLAALKERNSLRHIDSYLSGASNVFLMHNRDDFLLEEGDLEYLKDVFRDRMILYPRGGHVGNLWYDENFKRATQILDTGF